MTDFFSFFLNNSVLGGFVFWVKYLWFLWIPLISGYLFWVSWLAQVRARYIKSISWALLEIKIPRDVAKSPQAMETVLTSLYSTYSATWWKRVKTGFLPSWYSLEIASINGEIHFFAYVQDFFRNFFESQVYSQYPEAKIIEVEDYTYASDFNLEEWNLWGVEFGLVKADAYPIRTYVDFGLRETAPKEEQKINPLVSFLEFLGSLKNGEQVWFQILIRGAKKKWVEDGKKLVDELMGRNEDSSSEESKDKKLWAALAKSKGEQEVVAAIERNISKPGFETGVRVIYAARKDIFDFSNISAITGLMTQYNTYNLNGFKSSFSSLTGGLFASKRSKWKKEIVFDAFRRRSWFYAPYRRKSFVFNSEELATLYHFPGRVAATPTFTRIESKKGEPPLNLPV